jgi:DNA-binding NarL/FixJ family response regulator
MKIKVIVFEDNQLLREGLQELLETASNIEFLASFEDAKNVTHNVSLYNPDVILMDIHMPGITGIEALKQIKQTPSKAEVLMLTGFDDDVNIFESIKAGASGYLLKKTSPEKIIEAIMDANQGGAPMTSSVAKQVLQLFAGKPLANNNTFLLTEKEKQVLALLVNGYSYKMIASDLTIGIETVRTHIKHIYEKLRVNSKSEAVAIAINKRIV